jgi:hypothetical protein
VAVPDGWPSVIRTVEALASPEPPGMPGGFFTPVGSHDAVACRRPAPPRQRVFPRGAAIVQRVYSVRATPMRQLTPSFFGERVHAR